MIETQSPWCSWLVCHLWHQRIKATSDIAEHCLCVSLHPALPYLLVALAWTPLLSDTHDLQPNWKHCRWEYNPSSLTKTSKRYIESWKVVQSIYYYCAYTQCFLHLLFILHFIEYGCCECAWGQMKECLLCLISTKSLHVYWIHTQRQRAMWIGKISQLQHCACLCGLRFLSRVFYT